MNSLIKNGVLVMTAQTMTGKGVTITDFDIIIENGKPLIMFFVKDENGQFGIFNQNELQNFEETWTN